MTDLYLKTVYTTRAEWIVNEIFEYDIQKANISILLEYGYISPEEYHMYSQMNRINRQIAIGRMQTDKRYSEALSKGFEESRRKLCESNNLIDEEIVSIKKDAMYTLKKCHVTDFGNVHFTLRNVFRIYMRIMKLEIYFAWNEVTDSYLFDIKGISDDKLPVHTELLNRIGDILRYVQIGDIDTAITQAFVLRTCYLNHELPIECYREFNTDSKYRLYNSQYYVFDLTEDEKSGWETLIDDGFNNIFLNEFHRILVEMKFTR